MIREWQSEPETCQVGYEMRLVGLGLHRRSRYPSMLISDGVHVTAEPKHLCRCGRSSVSIAPT